MTVCHRSVGVTPGSFILNLTKLPDVELESAQAESEEEDAAAKSPDYEVAWHC